MQEVMPLSVRLSDQADALLEDMVASGKYSSKADVIRSALNYLISIEKERAAGREVIAVGPEVLKQLNLVTRFP